jgi:hypothetical protein
MVDTRLDVLNRRKICTIAKPLPATNRKSTDRSHFHFELDQLGICSGSHLDLQDKCNPEVVAVFIPNSASYCIYEDWNDISKKRDITHICLKYWRPATRIGQPSLGHHGSTICFSSAEAFQINLIRSGSSVETSTDFLKTINFGPRQLECLVFV